MQNADDQSFWESKQLFATKIEMCIKLSDSKDSSAE